MHHDPVAVFLTLGFASVITPSEILGTSDAVNIRFGFDSQGTPVFKEQSTPLSPVKANSGDDSQSVGLISLSANDVASIQKADPVSAEIYLLHNVYQQITRQLIHVVSDVANAALPEMMAEFELHIDILSQEFESISTHNMSEPKYAH